MRHLFKVVSALAIITLLSTLAPSGAFAQTSCTDQYIACINVSGQLGEPYQTMGDIECGLQYTGCVARKLRFW